MFPLFTDEGIKAFRRLQKALKIPEEVKKDPALRGSFVGVSRKFLDRKTSKTIQRQK